MLTLTEDICKNDAKIEQKRCKNDEKTMQKRTCCKESFLSFLPVFVWSLCSSA